MNREQPVSDKNRGYDDYCTDGSTVTASVSAVRAAETLWSLSGVAGTVQGGEVLVGLFD